MSDPRDEDFLKEITDMLDRPRRQFPRAAVGSTTAEKTSAVSIFGRVDGAAGRSFALCLLPLYAK